MTIVRDTAADMSWHPPRPPRHPVEPANARRADAIATAVIAGAIAVAGWPVILGWNAPGPLLPVPLLAHVAGMLAGYGVLVLVGLMARVPVLEHGIGADRMNPSGTG